MSVATSKAIKAYGAVKDNTDSGQFRAIQKAASRALSHLEITEKTIAKYSRRFDILVNALNELGFDAKKPKGSFYCYVKAPAGTENGRVFQYSIGILGISHKGIIDLNRTLG